MRGSAVRRRLTTADEHAKSNSRHSLTAPSTTSRCATRSQLRARISDYGRTDEAVMHDGLRDLGATRMVLQTRHDMTPRHQSSEGALKPLPTS